VSDEPEPLPDLVPPEEAPRRYPSTIGGIFYLAVLAGVGIGIGLAWSGDWRLGVKWFGGALVAAGAIRLVLRTRDAGMLAVRHRLVDVALLAGTGAVLIFLSESIPNQPV
jgi:hypothetical protein